MLHISMIRGKRCGDHIEKHHEIFTLYGMIGLAILKSKLDAKIEKAQSYPVKDLTL